MSPGGFYMVDGVSVGADSRSLPRFVPEEHLSVYLGDRGNPLVHGDIKNLSELGACVVAEDPLESSATVSVSVRTGYSFLFRAEARVVWRSTNLDHGIHFTSLSHFSRKLIRRLSAVGTGLESADNPFGSAGPMKPITMDRPRDDADSDPDLQILFRADFPVEAPPVEPVAAPGPAEADDRFDVLDDPFFEMSLVGESPPELDLDWHRTEAVELTGNLGYFDNADVLQMLEAARATGVLYVDGPCSGAIHLSNGRICRVSSGGLSNDEAAFRLIVARRGRFHFVPGPVRENGLRARTTTQVVLEAQLRKDLEH